MYQTSPMQATETDTDGVSRRSVTRHVLASGAVVLAPSVVSVARGATDSGEVELATSSTVPTDTGIEVRVFEDTNMDGTAENQQASDLSGGSETFELAGLGGSEASGIVYWMGITLTTSDDETTPSLDSATITLPEEATTPEATDTPLGEPERQSPQELWDNFLVFVAIAVGAMGALAGLGSKSMALGGFAAYLTFAYIAVETGHGLLENILFLTIPLIVIGLSFKLWRLEFGGDT